MGGTRDAGGPYINYVFNYEPVSILFPVHICQI